MRNMVEHMHTVGDMKSTILSSCLLLVQAVDQIQLGADQPARAGRIAAMVLMMYSVEPT
jgi:hypothetical protein